MSGIPARPDDSDVLGSNSSLRKSCSNFGRNVSGSSSTSTDMAARPLATCCQVRRNSARSSGRIGSSKWRNAAAALRYDRAITWPPLAQPSYQRDQKTSGDSDAVHTQAPHRYPQSMEEPAHERIGTTRAAQRQRVPCGNVCDSLHVSRRCHNENAAPKAVACQGQNAPALNACRRPSRPTSSLGECQASSDIATCRRPRL